MNFDDYKNKLEYPTKEYAWYFYSNGKCHAVAHTNEEKDDLFKRININPVREQIDCDGFELRKDEYRAETSRLNMKFAQDLFEEFGVEDNPKRDRCFSIAWEHGHSSGFSDVYSVFQDIVDLIRN